MKENTMLQLRCCSCWLALLNLEKLLPQFFLTVSERIYFEIHLKIRQFQLEIA